MTQRIYQLPENQAAALLNDLATDADALKMAQWVGPRNVILYITQTTNSTDYSITLPTGGGSGMANFTVTFTASQQNYAIALLKYRAYADGNEVHPKDALFPQLTITEVPASTASPLLTQFTCSFISPDGSGAPHTFAFKFQIQGSDAGTVSAA